jgi:hypothetical protein
MSEHGKMPYTVTNAIVMIDPQNTCSIADQHVQAEFSLSKLFK